jgi:hypothetical protein
MCKPPKKKKAKAESPPVEAPVIELGAENQAADTRSKKRRGRNQLRTGLSITPSGGGLSV